MRVLPNANLSEARPELRYGLFVLESIVRWIAGHEITVTSANDGKHMQGSRHYKNAGADVDWPPWEARPHRLGDVVRTAATILGPDYDLVPSDTYLHIEWDPR